jgi:hypothetical protein
MEIYHTVFIYATTFFVVLLKSEDLNSLKRLKRLKPSETFFLRLILDVAWDIAIRALFGYPGIFTLSYIIKKVFSIIIDIIMSDYI